MQNATETLMGHQGSSARFDISWEELQGPQVAALNERFQDRKDLIKLLGHRASEAGISEIRSLDDMVPLLFPHTAYKSYPESFLVEEKWDRLSKWLRTIFAVPDRAPRCWFDP